MKPRVYPYFQLITWGTHSEAEAWAAHLKAMGVPGALVARSLYDEDMKQTRQYSVWRAGEEATSDSFFCTPNSKLLKGDVVETWLGFEDTIKEGCAL